VVRRPEGRDAKNDLEPKGSGSCRLGNGNLGSSCRQALPSACLERLDRWTGRDWVHKSTLGFNWQLRPWVCLSHDFPRLMTSLRATAAGAN
jgi:hypothetical protein